jgi:hypothetical protein
MLSNYMLQNALSGMEINMNAEQIRQSLHRKMLLRYHKDKDTRVVNELGLKHGRSRADIAVINDYLIGFEIKSDVDSLKRLDLQIESYNSVFDRVTLVVGLNHLREAKMLIPQWWGITSAIEGYVGEINFETIRTEEMNPSVDDFSVAQLLWRNEVQEILINFGVIGKVLKQKRSILYRVLIDSLESQVLRSVVRKYIMNRRNWRYHEPLFLSDG